MKVWVGIGLIILVCGVGIATAHAKTEHVIVVMKEPPLPTQHLHARHIATLDTVLARNSERFGLFRTQKATVTRRFPKTDAAVVLASDDVIRKLKQDPDVAHVVPNTYFDLSLTDSIPLINATYAWNSALDTVSIRGAAIGVCIIDSGIENTHAAFAGRIVNQTCSCMIPTDGVGPGCCEGGATTHTSAEDDSTSSHGTHVTGIAAGNGGGIRGVAPDANILAVKACNATGSCALADIIAGIEFCLANKERWNVSVISMSLSDGSAVNTHDACSALPYFEPLNGLLSDAVAEGVFVTAASGNEGFQSGISFPACAENVTSVGSTTKSDTISAFTNRGDLLDVLAPGQSLTSAKRGNTTGVMSGTSMATPHIAGVATLLYHNENIHNRTPTPISIKNIITSTGTYIADWPRVDVKNALVLLNDGPEFLVDNISGFVRLRDVASVSFGGGVNVSNVTHCLNITHNNVTMNVSRCPELNRTARITIYTTAYNPVPRRNGAACTTCTDLDWTERSVSFNVSGFSSYTTVSGVSLLLNDTTETQTVFVTQQYNVTARLTNSSNAPVRNATCTYNDALLTHLMTWNEQRTWYETTINTSQSGNRSYNVTCVIETTTITGNGTAVITNDTLPPNIIVYQPVNETHVSTRDLVYTSNVTFFVSDNTSVLQCAVSHHTYTTVLDTVTTNANHTLSINLTNGTSYVNISCTDAVHMLTAWTGQYTLHVHTNVPPVQRVFIPNVTFQEDTVSDLNLSTYFFDENNETLTYTVHGSNPNISLEVINQTLSMTSKPNRSGIHTYAILATDTQNQTNISNPFVVTVVPVNDPVVLRTVIPNQSMYTGATHTINLSEYFYDVDSVLSFHVTNTSFVTIALANDTASITSSGTGHTSVVFSANDSTSNATSNNVTIVVGARPRVDTPDDSGSSGGGGGGGGGGGALAYTRRTETVQNTSCVSSWNCSSWGLCEAGFQRRTCVDPTGCNRDKPNTTMHCTREPYDVTQHSTFDTSTESLTTSREHASPIHWDVLTSIRPLTCVVVCSCVVLLIGAGFVCHAHAHRHDRKKQHRKKTKHLKRK